MFKYCSSYVLVLSGFTHLICCGIPIFLSFNSFLVNLILLDSITLDFYLLETAEIYLFSLTTLIFLVLISIEIYNKKVKCADYGCCPEQQCDSTKKTIKFNITLSAALYFVNSFIFLSEIIF